jgi:hypothetical protein
LAEFRLVAAPFFAAADLAAAPRPPPAGRRALFPLDRAAPPRLDPPAPAEPPRPLPPRPLVPVPPLRAPDRLAEVLDTAPRPEPPLAAPLRDVPDASERPDLLDPPDDEPDPPLPVPRLAPLPLAPRGGTLGRITSGDSSL